MKFPEYIDLRPQFLPVTSQEGLHACMAIVICDAIWWAYRQTGVSFIPSQAFLYYNARHEIGYAQSNVSINPSVAMNAVHTYGLCDVAVYPFDPKAYRERPPAQAYTAAQKRKAFQFIKLKQKEATLLTSLAAGEPFFCCIRLFPSNNRRFYRGKIAETGHISLPQINELPIFNHAMLVVGYDMKARHFIVRNSFGKKWGDNGYGYLPFDYLLNSNYAYACWRVESIPDIR